MSANDCGHNAATQCGQQHQTTLKKELRPIGGWHGRSSVTGFDIDGKTIIGKFTVGGGEAFEEVPVYAADGKTVIGQRMQRMQ